MTGDTLSFAKLIRDARIELGLSQQEVADDCGMSYVTVSQYEKGSRLVSFEYALRLAKYLGISLDDYKLTFPIPADHPKPRLIHVSGSEQTH